MFSQVEAKWALVLLWDVQRKLNKVLPMTWPPACASASGSAVIFRIFFQTFLISGTWPCDHTVPLPNAFLLKSPGLNGLCMFKKQLVPPWFPVEHYRNVLKSSDLSVRCPSHHVISTALPSVLFLSTFTDLSDLWLRKMLRHQLSALFESAFCCLCFNGICSINGDLLCCVLLNISD